MKKLMSVLLVAIIVLSCFAGCKKEEAAATTAPTAAPENAGPAVMTNEDMYGHIDQTVPVDGVYKIWNVEGVKNIANHPDAKFEVLCNMDLEGAVLAPIPEFTGDLDGANCTISNFTVQGEGESFGFVGVNKGKIHNLLLDKVTFVPGANAKNIGSMAGKNEGTIQRCTIGGDLNVTAAAEGASCGALAGASTGTLANNTINVNGNYAMTTGAKIGGIAGTLEGGTNEYLTTNGNLVVTGSNKTVGLFAGTAKNTHTQELAFVGAENSVDGKRMEAYFGAEENVTFERMLVRQEHAPLTEGQQKLRDRVVEEMYKMGTVVWYVTEPVDHTSTCADGQCHGVYEPEIKNVGMPYNHKNGSWNRFMYAVEQREDGSYQFKDWVYDTEGYDGYDMYIGNDCSTAVLQAYLTVSNSIDFVRSSYTTPAMKMGWIAVGDWEWDLGYDMTSSVHRQTDTYLEYNGPEVMYEAYACMRKGDGLGRNSDQGGHNRIISEDSIVVLDENGKIDPDYSYVLVHEQGPPSLDEATQTYSTWRINFKYSFTNLYYEDYIPITIEELVTGEMETPECCLEGGVDGSRLGLTVGTVKANYSLDAVVMEIKDADGNVVFNHTMFPTVTKRFDDSANDTLIRRVIMEYDLNGFAAPLSKIVFEPGEEYHATITGCLSTYDQIVVKDYTFKG